jgi:hypothetical protein
MVSISSITGIILQKKDVCCVSTAVVSLGMFDLAATPVPVPVPMTTPVKRHSSKNIIKVLAARAAGC